ncbi:MAG: hypothetical protein ACK43K_13325, partial [Chitinophagales bacterium]
HSTKSINEYYDIMYSEKVQNSFKHISRLEKFKKLMDIRRSIHLQSSTHSRFAEGEADSFSLELLKKTDYNLHKSCLAIQKLKYNDSDLFNMNVLLKNKFDFDSFQFMDKWLNKKMSMADVMKFTISDEEKDSLRSHPDTDARYLKAKSLITGEDNGKNFELSPALFQSMKRDFRLQTVYSLVDENRISFAIYHILKFEYEKFPDAYLDKMLIKCFDILEKAAENHELYKYVEAKNPYFSPEYNKLLIFIDNLSVSDLKNINKGFRARYIKK